MRANQAVADLAGWFARSGEEDRPVEQRDFDQAQAALDGLRDLGYTVSRTHTRRISGALHRENCGSLNPDGETHYPCDCGPRSPSTDPDVIDAELDAAIAASYQDRP